MSGGKRGRRCGCALSSELVDAWLAGRVRADDAALALRGLARRTPVPLPERVRPSVLARSTRRARGR